MGEFLSVEHPARRARALAAPSKGGQDTLKRWLGMSALSGARMDGRFFEIHAAPTEDDRWHAVLRFKDPFNPPASARLERDKLLEVFREP